MKPHFTNTGNPIDFPKTEKMMNERIRELAEQAELHATLLFNKDKLEKFAELIVRECMELTHWKDFDMSVEQRIRLSIYQDIKEHFGIEE